MSISYNPTPVLNVSKLFSINARQDEVFRTLGYSTKGVGGNLYRYDAASGATPDGGFVLPGIGGTLSFSGTTFNGTSGTGRFIAVDQSVVQAEHFGAIGDGTTDSSNAVLRAASVAGSPLVLFGAGTFIVGDVEVPGSSIRGQSTTSTVLKAKSGATYVLRLGQVSVSGSYGWDVKKVSDICIDGNSKASHGLVWGDTSRPAVVGHWALTNITIRNCDKGLFKEYGNIGNTFTKLQIRNCNYGMFAQGNASPAMHVGNDTWIDSEINSCSVAAIYYNGDAEPYEQSGALRINNSVIEGNPGFGIVVTGFRDRTPPVVIDGVWLELNATSGSVNLNGSGLAPTEIRITNSYAKIQNTEIESMSVINSNLLVDYCRLPERANYVTPADLSIDSDSYVRVTNARITNLFQPDVTVESIATNIYREGVDTVPRGNVSPVMRTSHRVSPIYSAPRGGVLMSSHHFDMASNTAFGLITASGVEDGLLKPVCAELVIADGAVARTNVTGLFKFTVTAAEADDWFVVTGGIKCVGSDPQANGLQMNITGDGGQFERYQVYALQDEWVTVASIAKGNDTTNGGSNPGGNAGLYIYNTSVSGDGSSPITIRLADWQCVRFPNYADALEFFNSRQFAVAPTSTISSLYGAGSPEGVVVANIGQLYTRTDGSTSTTLYIKESGTGNTGWVAK